MNQQAALFGEAESVQEVHAPFEQVLLGLSTLKGLGRKGLGVLSDLFGDELANVWVANATTLARALADERIPSAEALAHAIQAEKEAILGAGFERYEDLKQREITVLHGANLPERLRDVPDAPAWLFVEGSVAALTQQPSVAVVGTRQSSPRGEDAADLVAKLLAAYPLTLVSGLAEGIDAAVHAASLEYGVCNVAFLGTGIDVVFPKETAGIRERIVQQGGAVVSEYLPGESYGREKFVQRNRLQAGLAHLVVPVEAKEKSGTAHTVRFARELGRPLLGLRWKGNNGIFDTLKAHGDPVVDVFTAEGWRELDRRFRSVAEEAGQETYALAQAERRLLSEMKSRSLRLSDLERLRATLDEVERTLT